MKHRKLHELTEHEVAIALHVSYVVARAVLAVASLCHRLAKSECIEEIAYSVFEAIQVGLDAKPAVEYVDNGVGIDWFAYILVKDYAIFFDYNVNPDYIGIANVDDFRSHYKITD